jgi:hypothetical protein
MGLLFLRKYKVSEFLSGNVYAMRKENNLEREREREYPFLQMSPLKSMLACFFEVCV